MSATAFQRMRREKKKKQTSTSTKNLEKMTVEELKAYAKENSIDVGKSTSQKGILAKILSANNEEG